MNQRVDEDLTTLYEVDETAWLEAMAELVRLGRMEQLDYPHLVEYLTDMARRDRREVLSRLVVLLVHLLKWEHQPDKRNGSWQATILHQRQELRDLLDSRTLRNHAIEVLGKAYDRAVEQAVVEMEAEASLFPAACPWALDEVVPPE